MHIVISDEGTKIVNEFGNDLSKEEWKVIKLLVDDYFKKSKSTAIAVTTDQKISHCRAIRDQYGLYRHNKFIYDFANHSTQFYSSIWHRLDKKQVTEEEIHVRFKSMENPQDVSILDFFAEINNPKYTNQMKIVDFYWVYMDGKVGNATAETKASVELAKWIDEGKTTLREIEDCFLWLPKSGRPYKPSLMAVKSALGEFSLRKKDHNGRSSAASVLFKTKDEKSLEVLENRNYNKLAQESIAEMNSRNARLKELANV